MIRVRCPGLPNTILYCILVMEGLCPRIIYLLSMVLIGTQNNGKYCVFLLVTSGA